MKTEIKAKNMIRNEEASCVFIKDNEIIRSVKGRGVAPLISIYEKEPEIMQESFVVDKVIGKAAAMIITLGKAKKIYGQIMSRPAYDFLKKHDFKVEYETMIDNIKNRAGDDLCPLEKSVINIEDPQTGYDQLKKTLRKLKADQN